MQCCLACLLAIPSNGVLTVVLCALRHGSRRARGAGSSGGRALRHATGPSQSRGGRGSAFPRRSDTDAMAKSGRNCASDDPLMRSAPSQRKSAGGANPSRQDPRKPTLKKHPVHGHVMAFPRRQDVVDPTAVDMPTLLQIASAAMLKLQLKQMGHISPVRDCLRETASRESMSSSTSSSPSFVDDAVNVLADPHPLAFPPRDHWSVAGTDGSQSS